MYGNNGDMKRVLGADWSLARSSKNQSRSAHWAGRSQVKRQERRKLRYSLRKELHKEVVL